MGITLVSQERRLNELMVPTPEQLLSGPERPLKEVSLCQRDAGCAHDFKASSAPWFTLVFWKGKSTEGISKKRLDRVGVVWTARGVCKVVDK